MVKVFSYVCDVLEIDECDERCILSVWHVYVFGSVRGGRCKGEWVTGWVWALPILEEHGEVEYVSVFWLR